MKYQEQTNNQKIIEFVYYLYKFFPVHIMTLRYVNSRGIKQIIMNLSTE